MVLRRVCTRYGEIEGMAVEDPVITVFRGVPFAKAPMDELRWRAPQPVEPWDGVLHAHDFAPSAMQPRWDSDDFYGREWQMDPDSPRNEDCLYVNVWTPALHGSGAAQYDERIASQGGLPVMVWIHGGAYQCGSAAEKEFDGSALARLGVVVVSVTYRLNVFGFFTHTDLQHESDGIDVAEPCANFGLLDQRAAIEWVKNNVAVFGGNPEAITIFGQSAGAASVLAQICSPMNENLFQRAIMQSGAGLGMFNRHLCSLNDAQRLGSRFLDFIGVRSVEEARTVPAAELLDAAERFPALNQNHELFEGWPMPINWVPCVDGRFLTDQYGVTLAQGSQQPVDIIVGNTTGEFMETAADGTVIAAGEQGNLELMQAWVQGGSNPPFYYRFDVAMPGDDAGAFHSSDLWFTFNNLGKCWRPFSGWHYELANMMSRYWSNFAATGNPNESFGIADRDVLLPEWTRFEPATQAAMLFGKSVSMQKNC